MSKDAKVAMISHIVTVIYKSIYNNNKYTFVRWRVIRVMKEISLNAKIVAESYIKNATFVKFDQSAPKRKCLCVIDVWKIRRGTRIKVVNMRKYN